MDPAAHRSRNRRALRLVVAGLGALLILLTAFYALIQQRRELPAALVANRVILFILWYVNVVLIVVVLFVLLRNLIKLLIERRHRVLGSSFKLKLVATYVGLSLIPVLLLFAIATELLQGSIDRWFNTPVAPVLERGNAVAQALFDQVAATAERDAGRVLAALSSLDVGAAEDRPRLTLRTQELLSELGLDLLAVYHDGEFVHALVAPRSGLGDLPEQERSFLAEAAEQGRATSLVQPARVQGSLILAAVSRGPTVVVAGTLLDPEVSRQRQSLVEDYQSFRQLVVQKDELKASHLLLFLMVTLLILLASSWVGLYLARRVTVPIQALAEGTRRISGGDLAHRVDVAADDELGVLVESFNRMTEELAHGRQQLLASNRRLAGERAVIAAVLENVAAGVLSLDASGRIFTCNGAALAMLRQEEGAVLGKLPHEAWLDPERARLAALLVEQDLQRRPREVHMLLGGEWKTFEVKVSALADPAQVLGKVVVLEDLTELIKAQQLAAWSEAGRRIAHEIKNPLTPIRLAAERLLSKHRRGDPTLGKAIEDGVEIIVREVVTLQGMVDEFSRYARMPRPRPTHVDLPRLLAETVQLYRGVKPGVELADSAEGDLTRSWIDGEQIKRALINLLDNAVEATDAPGRVTVSARQLDGLLEIRVADTGRGIPPEAKEKLFRPYFSTKGRGTGLGLAIVHRIVADHQGSIHVEDNVPRGTVFTLELPGQ